MRRIFDYFRWRKASGEHDAPEELNEDRAADPPRSVTSTPPERTSGRQPEAQLNNPVSERPDSKPAPPVRLQREADLERLQRLKRKADRKHKRRQKRR